MVAGKILKAAAITAIVIVTILGYLILSEDISDIRFLDDKTLLDEISQYPEEATAGKPHTGIINPTIKADSSEILVASYYNIGFEQCVEPGARLTIDCDGRGVYDSYQNEIVEIPVNESRYIPLKVTTGNDTGTYRCNFEVMCDETRVASSSTALEITRS